MRKEKLIGIIAFGLLIAISLFISYKSYSIPITPVYSIIAKSKLPSHKEAYEHFKSCSVLNHMAKQGIMGD